MTVLEMIPHRLMGIKASVIFILGPAFVAVPHVSMSVTRTRRSWSLYELKPVLPSEMFDGLAGIHLNILVYAEFVFAAVCERHHWWDLELLYCGSIFGVPSVVV